MANENDKAVEILVREILYTIDKKISALKYDKTFKSVVLGKNADGTYKISYLNQEYSVSNAVEKDFKAGQSVWVRIPSGDFRGMHICGIAR